MVTLSTAALYNAHTIDRNTMESQEQILANIAAAALQLRRALYYAKSDDGGSDPHAYDDIDYKRDYLETCIGKYRELRSPR